MKIGKDLFKESAPTRVVTAKTPEWLFGEIEECKDRYGFGTRSDALNVLILVGLQALGGEDAASLSRLLGQRGGVRLPPSLAEAPAADREVA
jgi:hypothetical protein